MSPHTRYECQISELLMIYLVFVFTISIHCLFSIQFQFLVPSSAPASSSSWAEQHHSHCRLSDYQEKYNFLAQPCLVVAFKDEGSYGFMNIVNRIWKKQLYCQALPTDSCSWLILALFPAFPTQPPTGEVLHS